MTDSGIDWGKLKNKWNKWKNKLKLTGFLRVILTITMLYSLGYFLYWSICMRDYIANLFISRALPLAIINGCNVIALSILEKTDKK